MGFILKTDMATKKNFISSNHKGELSKSSKNQGSKIQANVEVAGASSLVEHPQASTNLILSQEMDRNLIITTYKNHSVVEIMNILESLGFKDIIVRSLDSKRFLLTF